MKELRNGTYIYHFSLEKAFLWASNWKQCFSFQLHWSWTNVWMVSCDPNVCTYITLLISGQVTYPCTVCCLQLIISLKTNWIQIFYDFMKIFEHVERWLLFGAALGKKSVIIFFPKYGLAVKLAVKLQTSILFVSGFQAESIEVIMFMS